MTQTLSREPDDPLFQPMRDRDPATPGDPLRRLRFHYGQCLSAEDFEAEQRYFVLRQRLHNALQHGVGTVWGLAIRCQEPAGEAGERLICEPGLAIDPLGREIWVTQSLCLDLAALETSFWDELLCPHEDPSDPEDDSVRRTYVVLTYQACPSDAVPVIPLPCGDDQEGLAYSRLRDSFRLCLEAKAPEDPYATVRDISRRQQPAEPRQRLLAHALNDPPVAPSLAPLERFWSGADDAGLLLATLDLEANGAASADGLQPVRRHAVLSPTTNPNNAVRAVLPAVQALADLCLDIRLEGPPAETERLVELEERREELSSASVSDFRASPPTLPFQAVGGRATPIDAAGNEVSDVNHAVAMRVELPLSERLLVDDKEIQASLSLAVQLLVWNETSRRWLEVTDHSSTTNPGKRTAWGISNEVEASAIWLRLEPAWREPTTFQVVLRGTGPGALMADSTPPRPLAGVAGEMVPAGCGRDAHLFVTYTPSPEAP